MYAFLRTLAIFLVIVSVSVWGANAMYDIRREGGEWKFYEKNPLPAMPADGLAMVVGGPVGPPVGHYDYCQRFVADCSIVGTDTRPTAMTAGRWAELVSVNEQVNRQVRPHPKDEDGRSTDLLLYGVSEYWTYPDGFGDCEDYVLAKRRLLMERGWPASSLLITMANSPTRGVHAVLTVRTDRGDFVLDNLNRQILAWYETAHRYTSRQSMNHSKKWTSVEDFRDLTKVAATN